MSCQHPKRDRHRSLRVHANMMGETRVTEECGACKRVRTVLVPRGQSTRDAELGPWKDAG